MYRSFSYEINKNISWKLVTVCLNLNHLVALGTCHRSTGMEDESLHLYFLYQHDPLWACSPDEDNTLHLPEPR